MKSLTSMKNPMCVSVISLLRCQTLMLWKTCCCCNPRTEEAQPDCYCCYPGMIKNQWERVKRPHSYTWVSIKERSDDLIQALSTNPEYLQNRVYMVVDYKDWQIPLGRRFRSLKLWMVLRLYGLEMLQNYLRKHVELAKLFEGLVSGDPRFEVVTRRNFSLVCFRLRSPAGDGNDDGEAHSNKLSRDLLEYVNSSGKMFITHTVLSHNKYVLRLVVGAPLIEERHIYHFRLETPACRMGPPMLS
ncbi:hypothetical protein DM860_010779 [Cuscuta australis]|uniref:Uncharacterized protein n=1 Tax=Cuscuta australis TaxID=267555 RepID=A0A328E009_9ASTE|nr:hypothetical protein DM860_010779 [Cuscuta australis]